MENELLDLAAAGRRDPTHMSRAASKGENGGSPAAPRSRQRVIRASIERLLMMT